MWIRSILSTHELKWGQCPQANTHRRQSWGGGDRGGSCPPLADKGGGQTVSNAPPFRRLSGMIPASTENIGICRWKCVKYYQKCVKFACNYTLKFFSWWGLRPSDPLSGLRPWTPPGDSRPQQWLKWFCEARGVTWRSQVRANPIPIPTPLIWRYLGKK